MRQMAVVDILYYSYLIILNLSIPHSGAGCLHRSRRMTREGDMNQASNQASNHATGQRTGLRRVRLSEWARAEGIARITAYRMLQRGILPVPSERSPTGRWYVLLPEKGTGRMAFYVRAPRGPYQAQSINEQLAALCEWAAPLRQTPRVVVREMADAYVDRMPKLARLLADRQITDIVIENAAVVGEFMYDLLVAALAPQGRSLLLADKRKRLRRIQLDDAHAAIRSLYKSIYGPERGAIVARRALDRENAA